MVRERRSIRRDAKFEQRRYKITYIIIVSTSQADIDYLPQLRATESPPPPTLGGCYDLSSGRLTEIFHRKSDTKSTFSCSCAKTHITFRGDAIFNIWSLSNRLRSMWLQYPCPAPAHSVIIFDAFPCHDFPAALVNPSILPFCVYSTSHKRVEFMIPVIFQTFTMKLSIKYG